MEQIKKNLLKSVTKFNGDFANFAQFIDTVKSTIDTIVDPAEISTVLKYAIQTCTTPACYNKLKGIEVDTFDNFKKNIDNILFASLTTSSLKNKLETTKQAPNQSISDYINDFRTTLSYLESKMPQEIVNSQFFKDEIKKSLSRNLLPKFKTIALINQKSSIQEIIKEILNNSDITEESSLENKIDQILVLTANKQQNSFQRNQNPWNNFNSNSYSNQNYWKNPNYNNNNRGRFNRYNQNSRNFSPNNNFQPRNRSQQRDFYNPSNNFRSHSQNNQHARNFSNNRNAQNAQNAQNTQNTHHVQNSSNNRVFQNNQHARNNSFPNNNKRTQNVRFDFIEQESQDAPNFQLEATNNSDT